MKEVSLCGKNSVYDEEKVQATERWVAVLRGENNTSMFYVVGQQRILLWRKLYKYTWTVLQGSTEEQHAAEAGHSKYPQQDSAREHPPQAINWIVRWRGL